MQENILPLPQQPADLVNSKEKKETNIDNKYTLVERFLNQKYSFQYNVVKGQLEYLNTQTRRYEPVTDRIENSILRTIRHNNIQCDSATLRAILLSDFTPAYDPFISYFDNLANWDGKDHIQKLADTVKTTNTDLWLICLKKWLVACIACLVDPNNINHSVIVFSGKQGLGKTTWMERLVPDSHRDYLFSGTVNPNNKDTLINLAECWLINLDELENLNRTEIGALKEMITKSGIRIRRPYGHNNENLPRRASFVGSVNAHQFLTDNTGSRRFLCFEALDIQHQHTVNIHQVYAQALQLYKDGFQYWFDKAETAAIERNNGQYQHKTAEEELLLTYFEWAEEDSAEMYLTTTQIVHHLSERGVRIQQGQSALRNMGAALRNHLFVRTKKHGNGNYVYALNGRSDVDIEVDSRHKEIVAKVEKQQTILYSQINL